MSAGARYIATAHNQQDQVETIVQRIFRGTGIRGLCGIPPVRSIGDGISLVRPLLSVGRETIESYLKRISQRYRVDSSNAETAYTRNQVRHEVLPALRQHFGQQVDQNLLQLAQHANDSQQVIDQLSQDLAASAVSYASDGVTTIDRALISKQPSHLVCELFREIWRHNRWPQRDMDAFKWQQLTILTVGKQGKTLTFPGNIRATADQKNLTLARSG